jgi:hypothetical protein
MMAPVTLLVALTLGILLGPITGQAQQAPKVTRVGVLCMAGCPPITGR